MQLFHRNMHEEFCLLTFASASGTQFLWVSAAYSFSYPCLCEAEQTALEYLGVAFSENFIRNDYMFCLTDSLW